MSDIESRLAVVETEVKNETKTREDMEDRLTKRVDKIEAMIRNGVVAILGMLAKTAFDLFKG